MHMNSSQTLKQQLCYGKEILLTNLNTSYLLTVIIILVNARINRRITQYSTSILSWCVCVCSE